MFLDGTAIVDSPKELCRSRLNKRVFTRRSAANVAGDDVNRERDVGQA